MPKADELYLLFQQCQDFYGATTNKWEAHFQWLEEVILLARQSRGEAFISKTPARKKRVKKNDIENQPPLSNSDVGTEDLGLRKSSRTAAKAAQEKTKQTLKEISNINSKIRRPSTPKKEIKIKAEVKRTEPDVIDISLEAEKTEDISCEEEYHEERIPKNVSKDEVIPTTSDQLSPSKSEVECTAQTEVNKFSSTEETEASNEDTDKEKPARSTRTKKLEKPSTPIKDILGNFNHVFKAPVPLAVVEDSGSSTEETEASNDNTDEGKATRSTRTKKLPRPSTPIKEVSKTNDHVFKAPVPAIAEDSCSSTEESSETSNTDQERPARSTRTKKLDKPSSPIKDLLKTDDHVFKVPVILQDDEATQPKPTRSTRTKKRVVEEKEEVPVRTTRTKKRKMLEESENSELSDATSDPGSPHTINLATSTYDETPEVVEPQPRVTRSKVRNLVNKGSPATKPQNQDCFSPKKQLKSVFQPSKYSDSPVRSPRNKNRKFVKGDVQEVSVEDIDVSSAGRIVKHTRTNDLKNMTSGFPRGKATYRTPSPVSLSSAKIFNIKNGLISSGSLQSSYSSKRGHVLGSPQVMVNKIIGTPTEVNRAKNILTGPSFLTKVQPSKPTKEESEERKQEELRRRKEREEETRRKKEESMKAKMEEQKRKNEERMRRVQEAREARERKLAMEREAQEKEKKLREERMAEEKRRMAQKNEMKQQQMQLKKKMALEEQQRAKEEMRLKEEQRKKEDEQRIKEEQKRIEENRLKIERQRKLLEMQREADRLAREKYELQKLNEAKRIAREKEELEQLKIKEAKRLAKEQLQESSANCVEESKPLNTTYNKSGSQSYEMTPVAKSKPTTHLDPNDYGISDLKSDDSTDEDCAPKKVIPSWAKGSQLKKLLYDQEYFPPNSDDIFPPQFLLRLPDLAQIFPKHRSRFFKRTSSAVWNTPPYKVMYSEKR